MRKGLPDLWEIWLWWHWFFRLLVSGSVRIHRCCFRPAHCYHSYGSSYACQHHALKLGTVVCGWTSSAMPSLLRDLHCEEIITKNHHLRTRLWHTHIASGVTSFVKLYIWAKLVCGSDPFHSAVVSTFHVWLWFLPCWHSFCLPCVISHGICCWPSPASAFAL